MIEPLRKAVAVDVSVVIVSYRVRDFTLACLESVKRHAGKCEVEVILVDNCSSDGTVEAVAKRFPEVMVVANRANLGFPAANNQGMRLARGRHTLLLNCDAELREGALERMVTFMDAHEEVALLGPRLVYANNSHQLSVNPFPTWWSVTMQYLRLAQAFPESRLLAPHRHALVPRDYPHATDVDWVSGACLLARREALEEIGLMDEVFFLYCEETDLCRRAWEAGWRVMYFPDAMVMHHGQMATGNVRPFALEQARKSLVHYVSRHGKGIDRAAVRTLVVLASCVQGVSAGLRWWIRHAPEDHQLLLSCRGSLAAALSRARVPRVPNLQHGPALQQARVSVIVPTYRRSWEAIQDTLLALSTQDPPPAEVVIVDQSREPDPRIPSFASQVGFRYLHIDTPGLPNARNVGASEAVGDVVAFIDDDAVPVRNWVGSHARRYRNTRIAAVVGQVLIPGRRSSKRARGYVGRFSPLDADFVDNYDADYPAEVDSLTGCNMSVRRSRLIEAGGFRVEYGGTAHLEESDLSLRLARRGGRLVFEPSAQVEHRVLPTGGCRAPDRSSWVYWYARNYALLYCSQFDGRGFLPFLAQRLVRILLFCWQDRSIRPLGAGLHGLLDGLLGYRSIARLDRNVPRWHGRLTPFARRPR